MSGYLLRRVASAIPLLLGISIVVFILMQMAPGGPFSPGEDTATSAAIKQMARLRERLGLEDPLHLQYLRWIGGVVNGDWGTSFNSGRGVLVVIGERIPTTILLITTAFIVSIVVSMLVGVTSGVKRGSWFDHAMTGATFTGLSIPGFWLAILLIYLFAHTLDWLPAGGLRDLRSTSTGIDAVLDTARHLILPVISLVLVSIAELTRHIRSSVIDVLDHDYVRTARASGLPERQVIYRHVIKNASLPVITIALLTIPGLLLGTVIVETIFGLPGMGRLFVEAAAMQDYPVLLGVLMLSATLVVVANLLADILYARMDPRISYG